jgi:hypothetical protein
MEEEEKEEEEEEEGRPLRPLPETTSTRQTWTVPYVGGWVEGRRVTRYRGERKCMSGKESNVLIHYAQIRLALLPALPRTPPSLPPSLP